LICVPIPVQSYENHYYFLSLNRIVFSFFKPKSDIINHSTLIIVYDITFPRAFFSFLKEKKGLFQYLWFDTLDFLLLPILTMPRKRAHDGHTYVLRWNMLICLRSICLRSTGSVMLKPLYVAIVFHLGTVLPQKPQLTLDSCPFDFVCLYPRVYGAGISTTSV